MADENSKRSSSEDGESLAAGSPAELEGESLPPVVSRLVVEIRSDGTRTVARGAMEDVTSGQSVAIEAHGDSPLKLALALAKSMSGLRFAKSAVRALLPGRRGAKEPSE